MPPYITLESNEINTIDMLEIKAICTLHTAPDEFTMQIIFKDGTQVNATYASNRLLLKDYNRVLVNMRKHTQVI